MIAVIIFGLLATGSWISAYQCKKQINFYKEHTCRLFGTVISVDKHKNDNGKYKETYYDLEIMEKSGETYHVSTQNKKVCKYKCKNNITIIVPEQVYKDINIPYCDKLNPKERTGTLSDTEAEKPAELSQINHKHIEISNHLNTEFQKYFIMDENIKAPFNFGLSIVMGVLLTIFTFNLIKYFIFN